MPPGIPDRMSAVAYVTRGRLTRRCSCGSEAGVECFPQRDVARVTREGRSHLARYVRVTDPRRRIGKAEGPAGARRAERPNATEPPDAARFHEAEGEVHLALQ